jgi:hypothetical protein
MSMYAAKEPDEQRTRLADVLRKRKAEAVDNAMLKRLEHERKLHSLDAKMAELHAMAASTDHPKLKALLSTALSKLADVREHIQC